MRYLIVLLLSALVLLSGCTLWEDNSRPVKPLTISLESDLTNVRSNDITYLYLILDNLDKKEEYDVETKIMGSGIFEVTEQPEDTELSGLQKKSLEWTLTAPNVDKETPSTVSVETKISKEFEFYLPIKFASSAYLRGREQGGNPVPKEPKNYQFSDNLVGVNVELNKKPPIDTKAAYANMEINPKIDGILNITSISSDGDCELDRFNTISCEFPSSEVEQIKEKKFKVTLDYYVKIVKSLDFVVLPEAAAEIPSGGETPISGGPEIVLKNEKGQNLDFDVINTREGSYFYVLGLDKPIREAALDTHTQGGGGIIDKKAKIIPQTTYEEASKDFCKLVEILEFSRSSNQLECTDTGFCIITPPTLPRLSFFCGTEKAKEYIESIGLAHSLIGSLEKSLHFNGSLLYNYQSGEWCYIKDKDVPCKEIQNEFGDDCKSGELLKNYVSKYNSKNAKCYKEGEYISWYISGDIDMKRPNIYSDWCMKIVFEFPTKKECYKRVCTNGECHYEPISCIRKYYEPSNCNKINKKWADKYSKYSSIVYLRLGDYAKRAEIKVKEQMISR